MIPHRGENDITYLREELARTRYTVIQLMPSRVREVLETSFDCRSTADLSKWQRDAADSLLELAEPWPSRGIEGGSLSPRARCPLCSGGSDSAAGADGFAIPEGLLRHLLGSHNANPCPVFEVATALCREHVFEVESRARSVLQRDARG